MAVVTTDTSTVSSHVPISRARAELPELIERVIAGDEVTLTRHGVPVAVMVRPDTLRLRRAEGALAGAATIRSILDGGRRTVLAARPTISSERAKALVAEVRAGRSRR